LGRAAQPVRARHAMVVTRERHATQAGVEVLRAGGNAIDAAVAVAYDTGLLARLRQLVSR